MWHFLSYLSKHINQSQLYILHKTRVRFHKVECYIFHYFCIISSLILSILLHLTAFLISPGHDFLFRPLLLFLVDFASYDSPDIFSSLNLVICTNQLNCFASFTRCFGLAFTTQLWSQRLYRVSSLTLRAIHSGLHGLI